ncbi:endonuclease MutS2 [Paradesulfitobacterium aromaticivorans]
MSIQERVLQKLDFPKIKERLAEFCRLPRSRELALALRPYTEIERVRLLLQETDEGKELLRLNPLFSVGGAKEVRPYLERCLRGGALSPEELLQVRDTLRSGRQVRNFFNEEKGDFLRLREVAGRIVPDRVVEDGISVAITEDAAVSDNASLELAQLRKAKLRVQQRIRDSLEGILRNSAQQKMLQDLLITQRGDRYVVPVKQEYRGAFPGIVHDQSASGATLFIEPLAVVNLGNELREVILKEQREVERILNMLSRLIEGKAEQIADLHEALARLDFILVKGHLSAQMNGGSPKPAEGQVVKLTEARHPLLSGKVVPLSLELGTEFSTLVITGPNTGGKTVALKTIGLLCAMAQAGLHIPAESESALGVFTQIFADIGDEQSVEQSLSTFSGHMKNIVEIAATADGNSLILLDEIGAGTDPTEGAALAMAILAELHERGSRIVATTHYGALKAFAYETPGVENSSVEFDVETLRPTYRLLVGIPGRSNALTIAGRLGLGEGILSRARKYFSEREIQMEDLLENLEDTHREIEAEKHKAELVRAAVEEKHKEIRLKSLKLDDEYERIINKGKDEAENIIRQTRREAEELLAELKEAVKKEHKQQQDIERARQGLKRLAGKVEEKGQGLVSNSSGLRAQDIKLGQTVYMTKLRQKGQILKLPNESGEVLVQAGVLKVSVSLADLRLAEDEKPVVPMRSGEGRLGRGKMETVRTEIDLRGMQIEEATYTLDKYLDDAVLSGISQIYVIHGKGTGALRSGMQEFLRGHPHVRSFRLGQHGEGDLGVTVVELK